jgi:hypothetical protein
MNGDLFIEDSEFGTAQAVLQGYLQTLSGYFSDYSQIITYLATQDQALYSTALATKVAGKVTTLANHLVECSKGKPELVNQYLQDVDQRDGVIYQ